MSREPVNANAATVSATRIVSVGGATLLVGASAALGSYYGFTVGNAQHVALGVVMACAALGGELLKPFAVAEAVSALSRFNLPRAVLCLLLAFVCICYNITAELSLSAGSRGDLVASRGAVADATKDARADRERAKTELAALPPARPSAEINAERTILERDRLFDRSKQCTEATTQASRDLCTQIDKLAGEQARAQRRAELEARIKAATAKLANTTQSVRDADPGASVISAYARDLGWMISPERIFPWLSLVPVVLLELGSSLAVVVARAQAPKPPGAPQRPIWSRRCQTVPASSSGRPEPSSAAQNRNPTEGAPEFAQRIADLVSSPSALPPGLMIGPDGFLWAPQRVLAKALGYKNASRVNRQLRDAAQAGLIDYRSGPTGTAVKVLGKVGA